MLANKIAVVLSEFFIHTSLVIHIGSHDMRGNNAEFPYWIASKFDMPIRLYCYRETCKIST